jgi:hypothetical protein
MTDSSHSRRSHSRRSRASRIRSGNRRTGSRRRTGNLRSRAGRPYHLLVEDIEGRASTKQRRSRKGGDTAEANDMDREPIVGGSFRPCSDAEALLTWN